MSRYGNIEYVNNLEWVEGIELVNKARQNIIEQREWEMWLSVYPNMDKDNFIPYEKFRSKPSKADKPKQNLTKSEIIERYEEIRLLHQGKHEGVVKDGII